MDTYNMFNYIENNHLLFINNPTSSIHLNGSEGSLTHFTKKENKEDIFGIHDAVNNQHGENHNKYEPYSAHQHNTVGYEREYRSEVSSNSNDHNIDMQSNNHLNSVDRSNNDKVQVHKNSDVININSEDGDEYCEIIGEVKAMTSSMMKSLKIEQNQSQNSSHLIGDAAKFVNTSTSGLPDCENLFDFQGAPAKDVTLDPKLSRKKSFKDKDYSVPLSVDTSLQYTMSDDVIDSSSGHVGLLMIVSAEICSSDSQKNVCNKGGPEVERYDPYLPSCAPDTDSDSNDTWPGSYNQNNYQTEYHQVPTQYETNQGYMGIGAWQYNSCYTDYHGMCPGTDYYNSDIKNTCYTTTSYTRINHVNNQGFHNHQVFYNSSPMQANSMFYSCSPFSAYVVNTNFSKGTSTFMPHTHFGTNIYAEEWLMNQ